MRRKLGVVLMALGVLLLLGAATLLISNRQEEQRAAAAVEQVLPQLTQIIAQAPPPKETLPPAVDVPGVTEPDITMTEKEIDGDLYIGYLSIERLGLELPVMSDWSYEQLKSAPCRFYGSAKSDDLVLMAHSYKRHFGPIGDLQEGDRVSFVDMDGKLWEYAVVTVETLQPTAVEDMTAGVFDLTLFTCTYGGQSRVTVRCDLVEE